MWSNVQIDAYYFVDFSTKEGTKLNTTKIYRARELRDFENQKFNGYMQDSYPIPNMLYRGVLEGSYVFLRIIKT